MSVVGHSRAVRTDDHGFRSTPMSGHSQDRRPCFKGARLASRFATLSPDMCESRPRAGVTSLQLRGRYDGKTNQERAIAEIDRPR